MRRMFCTHVDVYTTIGRGHASDLMPIYTVTSTSITLRYASQSNNPEHDDNVAMRFGYISFDGGVDT
jgi:hypothetical protein